MDSWRWAVPSAGVCVVLLLAVLGAGAVAAQPERVPTNGGDRGAARDYVAEVRANFTPENRSYWSTRSTLGFIRPLYDVGVALLLLFSRLSARMRDVAYARAASRYPRVLIYLVLYLVVSFVLDFPFSWYRGFALEHQYGLSNQSFGAWLAEGGKDAAVSFVLLGLTGLVSLCTLVIEKSPRRWWLWIGLGTLPVIVAGTLIQPLVVDPLYNRFTPLRDQELKGKILALAAKADIPGRNVYQVDKSKQTKKLNAYVNGFGASQRIVLWDTTLQGMKEDEILFVMGHEMGHYKLAHIWKGIAFYSILSLAFFFSSGVVARAAVRRWGGRWRFHDLHDVASLPLLIGALTLVSLPAEPLANFFGRRIEHEADVFSLEVTHLNDAGARAFIKLGSQNKSNPEPPELVKIFQYTHPPPIERIRFALTYRPWETGEPNRAFRPRH